MNKNSNEALKSLKTKFKAFKPAQREDLSICFLKINLGVNSSEEGDRVKIFLEGFPLDLTPGKLDAFINFLHSGDEVAPDSISLLNQTHDLPKYEVNDLSVDTFKIMKENAAAKKEQILPEYDENNVETLTENRNPFK